MSAGSGLTSSTREPAAAAPAPADAAAGVDTDSGRGVAPTPPTALAALVAAAPELPPSAISWQLAPPGTTTLAEKLPGACDEARPTEGEDDSGECGGQASRSAGAGASAVPQAARAQLRPSGGAAPSADSVGSTAGAARAPGAGATRPGLAETPSWLTTSFRTMLGSLGAPAAGGQVGGLSGRAGLEELQPTTRMERLLLRLDQISGPEAAGGAASGREGGPAPWRESVVFEPGGTGGFSIGLNPLAAMEEHGGLYEAEGAEEESEAAGGTSVWPPPVLGEDPLISAPRRPPHDRGRARPPESARSGSRLAAQMPEPAATVMLTRRVTRSRAGLRSRAGGDGGGTPSTTHSRAGDFADAGTAAEEEGGAADGRGADDADRFPRSWVSGARRRGSELATPPEAEGAAQSLAAKAFNVPESLFGSDDSGSDDAQDVAGFLF